MEPDQGGTVVLVHGGLWEDMDARRFWVQPGVVAGLAAAGLQVLAPDRLRRAPSWAAEVAHLVDLVPPGSTVVGGSNGCSVAARLAVDWPDRVGRLVLAWPATAGDAAIDSRLRAELGSAAGLLDGDTLRGVSDVELAELRMPVAVLPSAPPNPYHQRSTVDALLSTIPGAVELPGTPESPRPEFAEHRDRFVAAVVQASGMSPASVGRKPQASK